MRRFTRFTKIDSVYRRREDGDDEGDEDDGEMTTKMVKMKENEKMSLVKEKNSGK